MDDIRRISALISDVWFEWLRYEYTYSADLICDVLLSGAPNLGKAVMRARTLEHAERTDLVELLAEVEEAYERL